MSQTNSNFRNMSIRLDVLKFSKLLLRTEGQKGQSTVIVCQLTNNLHQIEDFLLTTGLKERIMAHMWNIENSGFCENNVCSWLTFYDSGNFKNAWEEI